MNTDVIILAQGKQNRLRNLLLHKQMLPLPACGATPILYRTLRQLWHLLDGVNIKPDRHERVTVVTWPALVETLRQEPVEISRYVTYGNEIANWRFYPGAETLADPGNSSLKGIHRYLTQAHEGDRALLRRFGRMPIPYDRTIVLLGDVVYSWDCLRRVIDAARPDRSIQVMQATPALGFVGTRDISHGGGELWGLGWSADAGPIMEDALGNALAKHPPFTEYQPGQMRRWMWAIHPTFENTPRYHAVDDYTRDIDTPEHVTGLGPLSELAAADDAEHGVVW